MCKCGDKDCTGFYLLHPAEMVDLPRLKEKELKENPSCTFNLVDSDSSGEIFTKFRELHVIVKPVAKINKGDFVWFTKTFDEIYWRPGMFKVATTTVPFKMKVIDIVETKDGLLYQTKKGHFHENWVGEVVFITEEEANNKIKSVTE